MSISVDHSSYTVVMTSGAITMSCVLSDGVYNRKESSLEARLGYTSERERSLEDRLVYTSEEGT